MHTSVATVLPLLAAPAIILARARSWLHLALAALASAAILAPFILYEFQFEWKDYANFRYYSSLQSFTDLDAARWLVAITTGWQLPSDGVVPPPERTLPRFLPPAAAALALALLTLGVVAAIANLIPRKNSKQTDPGTRTRAAGLLLWLALPVALSVRHWQPLFLHYYFPQLPAAFVLMALPATRRFGSIPKALAVAVAAIQAIALLASTHYEATAAGTDPCFIPSIASSRAAAYEFAQFGHARNANAAIVELDSPDARSMAYLLRADFADVYLPHPVAPSQTPNMFGNVGLHRTLPTQALQPEPAIPPLLTAATEPGVRFDNGVALHEVRFSPSSSARQLLHMAIAWSVDATATSRRPIVWQLTLQSADGSKLQVDSGDSAFPAALQGQSVVSWFTIDTRRELAPNDRPPGAYQLALELIDTFGDPPAPLPFTNGERTLRFPVEITAFDRCPYPTAVP